MLAARRALHNPAAGGGAFTPASIAGLTMWFDASQITGHTDNTPLASWADLSGNSHTMTQATGAAQPTYYSSTAGKTINGLPAVWFDGTDDWMAETAALTLLPVTVFAAVNNPMPGVSTQTLVGAGGGGGLQFRLNAGRPDLLSQYTADLGSATGSLPAAPAVFGITLDGTTGTYYINSHTADSTVASHSMTSQTVVLGYNPQALGEFWGNGTPAAMAEVVIYNSVLSATNVTKVVNYLGTKWGVTVT